RTRRDPPGTAARHPRIAAGDRRERLADAPRDRRPDRGACGTQPYRRAARPRHGCAAARVGPPRQSRRGGRGEHGRRAWSAFGAAPRHHEPVAAADVPSDAVARQRVPPPPRRPGPPRPPPPRAPRAPNGPGPPAGGPAGPGGRAGGWLTALLSRASRETDGMRDDDRPPMRPDDRAARHSIESLDSLSVDIARMIDHNAASDLWDRYNRGERNGFTH